MTTRESAPPLQENRQLVVDVLRAAGVDTIFGVIGNGNVDIVADAIERAGMRYMAARHEAGAVAMADAYSRAADRIGVATVTHGPGLTNAVTALTTAARASSRVILLAGDAIGFPGRSTQRIDQRAVIAPTGAHWVAPGSRGWDLAARDAVESARQGRCTVLNLPVEGMLTSADRELVAAPPPAEVPSTAAADLDRAAVLLAQAERPLILAGRGAVRTGVRESLVELAARLGAPLGTSLAARDLFDGVPDQIGLVGGFATPESMVVARSCDVVLSVGASLNQFTTDDDRLLGRARIIGIDRDPRAGTAVQLPLIGDAAALIDALLERVPRPDTPHAVWRAEDTSGQTFPASPESSGLAAAVLERLDALAPSERTVVYDHGNLATSAMGFLRGPDPAGFIFMADFGSIGLSLPAAVGASAGRPDRLTVCVVGDGALMMSLAELDTLARVGGDVLVLVLNDRAYGAEYPLLAQAGADPRIAVFDSARVSAIAEGVGIPSVLVASPADLSRVEEALARRGPRLLEVLCQQPLVEGSGR